MTIYFDDGFDINSSLTNVLVKAADTCIEMERKEGKVSIDPEKCSVSVSFVDKDEIKRMNKTHRGIDKVTDVLSFPQFENIGEAPTDTDILLGDVVICPEVAAEQAEEYGHSQMRELLYLFTHSILHLLGYDHEAEDEKAVMRDKEEKVMEALGLTRE